MVDNNHKNPIVIQSKVALRQAFLSLICKKNIAKITITEIAKKACVARQTFYLHYETKEELLLDVFDDLFGKTYKKYFETWKINQDDELRLTRLTEGFMKYKEHAHLISAMAQSGQLEIVEKNTGMIIDWHLHNLMELYHAEIPPKLMNMFVQYFTGAFMAIVIQWISSGMEVTPHTLAVIYTRLSGKIYEYIFQQSELDNKLDRSS